MKINSVDNQNFNGKYIIQGKISQKNLRILESHISGNRNIRREPFNIYVKQSKTGNILMALNKDFSHSYGIRKDKISRHAFSDAYNRLAKYAHDKYQKCSVLDQLLCSLNMKKII